MGSLYRSQHELLPLFKKGDAPHVNNVELGKKGRWRSNVWTYPGASSIGSDARQGLQDHPTVKPTAMFEDALLDLTNRGDIVLDPFLGSGSTLIAAVRAGRICRGVELDPLYVDVIIRRYEAETGHAAVLQETPRQNSSGGKQRLGHISKMGNRYLRTLLVVGAHAVLYHRKPHEDALRSWAKKLMQSKPFKLVAVALANKIARIAFAIMRGKTTYSAVPA